MGLAAILFLCLLKGFPSRRNVRASRWGMRDVIVLAIILGSSPICLFSPYYGILVWTWIAYFNPHRFTYGIAYHFPVAVPIAIPTIVGTIFTRQKNRRIFTIE